jgi:proteasome lid subunit RPN8/RPN11
MWAMDADIQGTAGGAALLIAADVLAALLADARSDPAHERCGLLLGSGSVAVGFAPAANVAADPARHFEIDPAVLIAAHREARGGGAAVIGCYHSHPQGCAEPSATDAAMAASDGGYWLIVTGDDVQAWQTQPGRPRFIPARLIFAAAA